MFPFPSPTPRPRPRSLPELYPPSSVFIVSVPSATTITITITMTTATTTRTRPLQLALMVVLQQYICVGEDGVVVGSGGGVGSGIESHTESS